MKRNQKHRGNKNRIFTTTKYIGIQPKAWMKSFCEILRKCTLSAWLTDSYVNGKRIRQKFTQKFFVSSRLRFSASRQCSERKSWLQFLQYHQVRPLWFGCQRPLPTVWTHRCAAKREESSGICLICKSCCHKQPAVLETLGL